jgi:ribosomal protein L17
VVVNSVLERKRRQQVDKFTSIRNDMKLEQKLVKTIKKVLLRIENPRYRYWTRAVVLFDPLFIAVEPDPKKRRAVLMRIFKLRPRTGDALWVTVIWRHQSSQHKQSLRYAIKYKLINKQV